MTVQYRPFHRTQDRSEVRRIGRLRFPAVYWPTLDKVIDSCSEVHSLVLNTSNKDNALAGFVLVCPPFSEAFYDYTLHNHFPEGVGYEVAFIAMDPAWEGKGHARRMIQTVTQNLINCWLHVDYDNEKAKGLYESLGFQTRLSLHDPLGSFGDLMVLSRNHKLTGNSHMEKRTTLFDAGPCETEQAFCRGIFSPPLMAGC